MALILFALRERDELRLDLRRGQHAEARAALRDGDLDLVGLEVGREERLEGRDGNFDGVDGLARLARLLEGLLEQVRRLLLLDARRTCLVPEKMTRRVNLEKLRARLVIDAGWGERRVGGSGGRA